MSFSTAAEKTCYNKCSKYILNQLFMLVISSDSYSDKIHIFDFRHVATSIDLCWPEHKSDCNLSWFSQGSSSPQRAGNVLCVCVMWQLNNYS